VGIYTSLAKGLDNYIALLWPLESNHFRNGIPPLPFPAWSFHLLFFTGIFHVCADISHLDSSFLFRAPPGLQTSLHEIYTKLRTFVNQNWRVALYRSARPTSLNTMHQTVEGCSETSPLYLCVHKSGDIESVSLSGEMFSELEMLCGCGWTEVRSEEES